MAGAMKRRYLEFVKPGQVEVGEEALPPLPADQVLVKAQYSAISPGTEGLVYRGQFPDALEADANLAMLPGLLKYPVRYGYALVGQVVETGPDVDPSLRGRRVMAFHPHASHFQASPADLVWLHDEVDPLDAVFLPNMETAVTLVHDSAPLIGEVVIVIGQGVVGLLTTALLARIRLGELIALEPVKTRREWSSKFGADTVTNPGDPRAFELLTTHLGLPDQGTGADLCIELSGQPSALDQAIQLTRFSGRIIIGSWYGTRRAELDLGSHFHRSRIQLYSSQVSTIKPELGARWSKGRRLDLAQKLLPEIQPSRLITHTLPLEDAPKAYALLDQSPGDALGIVFRYSQ